MINAKCLAIIQARMSSRRLPGKVLLNLAGKAVLKHVIERVILARRVAKIVVATSLRNDDDPIEVFCKQHQIDCFRGELDNVAARFGALLMRYNPPFFARISADSPLYDNALLDRAISIFERGNYDIVTNVLKRTYPKGHSVEIISTPHFIKHLPNILTPYDREHVTPYFYRTEGVSRIYSLELPSAQNRKDLSYCIDEQGDLERLERELLKKIQRD